MLGNSFPKLPPHPACSSRFSHGARLRRLPCPHHSPAMVLFCQVLLLAFHSLWSTGTPLTMTLQASLMHIFILFLLLCFHFTFVYVSAYYSPWHGIDAQRFTEWSFINRTALRRWWERKTLCPDFSMASKIHIFFPLESLVLEIFADLLLFRI